MRKKTDEYRLVIFDLDGTLYLKHPLRLAMAGKLLGFYLLRPGRIKELLSLKRYRDIREKADSLTEEDAARQYGEAGRPYGLDAAAVEAVIRYWMYRAPCKILKRFRDDGVAELISALQERGIMTAVYSDYPVSGKLKALEIDTPFQFCASDPQIQRMKPDPKGILAVLQRCGVKANEAVMIGDRMDKDGMAAINAGIDYCVLPPGPVKRKKAVKGLFP